MTPAAPKKVSALPRRRKPVWQRLRESGKIRAKYAYYTPEDVSEIDDVEMLRHLYSKYSLPSSQPQNDVEWEYFNLMSLCLWRRLRDL